MLLKMVLGIVSSVSGMPISVRALVEIYIMNHQVGYLAHEYLDAKLIRSEAIKVLQLS